MTTPKQRYLTRSAAQALIEQRRLEYRQAKKNRFSGEETPTQQMFRWDSPLTYHTDGTPPWWQVPNPMPEVVVKPDQSAFVRQLQNEELQSQAAQQWGLDRLAEVHRIAQEAEKEAERERAAKRTIESIQMENIGKMQEQLYNIGAFGSLPYNKAVDGRDGKLTQEALKNAEAKGYKWNAAAGKLEKSEKNINTDLLRYLVKPPTATGVLRDHLHGMVYNIPVIGDLIPPITNTNDDYSDTFNESGREVTRIALSRFKKAGMLPTEIGVPKLMTDTQKGAKDGGITGRDFREFNAPEGGGYARQDLRRYASAAVGGRYAFEYGPGGANLEVTRTSPETYQARVFDNNNFDNSTLSEEEKKNVGLFRLLAGVLIGKGGKKVRRNFTYDFDASDIK